MTGNIYSEPIFIGRGKEIDQFLEVLSGNTNRWVLCVRGGGGIGKTRLLYRYIELAKERMGDNILMTDQLIDFYWTVHQQELGILKSIAEQLQPTQFKEFFKALRAYEAKAHEILPNPDIMDERKMDALKKFFGEYAQLKTEKILLFFDTAEEGGTEVRRFLHETLVHLKKLHKGTLAVVAGRPSQNIELSDEHALIQDVGKFVESDVSRYLASYDINLDEHIIQRITNLTEGHPILIALTVDWLQYGYSVDDLVNCPQDHFERLMVRRIQELKFNVDQVILIMAHLYRRFDKNILADVLQLSEEESQKLIQSASEFSFVKCRPPSKEDKVGSCLLHDKMRDLINRFVWPELDPFRTHRRGWNQKIIVYYEELINSNEAEHQYLESKALKLERLFYLADLSQDLAFDYAETLFDQARSHQDIDWMKAISHELENVRSKLESPTSREIFWDALVLHFDGDYREAAKKLSPLVAITSDDLLLSASIRSQFIESLIYSSDVKVAIELGTQAEIWFDEKLPELSKQQSQLKKIYFEYGKLCNNIGLAYRNRNNLNQTILYYEKALGYFEKSNVDNRTRIEIANTKNNLAFVYHKLGRDDEALSHGESALRIRRKLESPAPVGYSYNVLAMIYVDQLRQQEARAYFSKALEAFEAAGSVRGKGLVYIGLGRALRQLGRHKERYGIETLNPNREEYQEAERMLSEAVNIFRRLGDEATLSEALNEKGTLLRQQEKWEDAIECLQESSQLSEKKGNTYRQVDNLVDIAITYDYQGEADLALKMAREASLIALDETKQLQAYNLFAKAQEVIANNLFTHYKDYDKAFNAVANACIYIMRLDPEKQGESPAKRELYYDHMVNWAEEKLLALPSHDLVIEKSKFLIDHWHKAKLADTYPGFIIRMQDAAREYEFLKP